MNIKGQALAGAMVVEDMASVHLSISKHSVIFPLHRRGGHFFFLFFSASPSPSLHFCFPPFHLSTRHLSFYILPPLAFIRFFFSAFSCFRLHPSPLRSLLPPLLVVCGALSGTAHSATKQSCLQHHTLANQARPECSSSQIYSTAPWYRAAEGPNRMSHKEESHLRHIQHLRIWRGWEE